MMPSKWHWKRSSYENVASRNFCYWSGWNDREPNRRWKHEDIYEVAELTSHEKSGFQKKGLGQVGGRGEIKWELTEWIMWKNVIYRAALHRPVHQLCFYLSCGLNQPSGSMLKATLPNWLSTEPQLSYPACHPTDTLPSAWRSGQKTSWTQVSNIWWTSGAAGPEQQGQHICNVSHCSFHVCLLVVTAFWQRAVFLPSHPSLWRTPQLGREARL